MKRRRNVCFFRKCPNNFTNYKSLTNQICFQIPNIFNLKKIVVFHKSEMINATFRARVLLNIDRFFKIWHLAYDLMYSSKSSSSLMKERNSTLEFELFLMATSSSMVICRRLTALPISFILSLLATIPFDNSYEWGKCSNSVKRECTGEGTLGLLINWRTSSLTTDFNK